MLEITKYIQCVGAYIILDALPQFFKCLTHCKTNTQAKLVILYSSLNLFTLQKLENLGRFCSNSKTCIADTLENSKPFIPILFSNEASALL